ncbi:putative beta-lysine N-acetyltransferase [Methanohalophilus levihalophilus]|uniref:putative beta-lysine N-acetyltransferase n=1 Tax=Methanohalophilus levihalophilus TaxID=1431282 RepID=UPI001FD8CF31|nr:putative beta-lysine N-acetyltransferase [Methanohalophilus levihalophilus]MBP2031214.1 putative beta-lysine N-acetyltransferase [Methanohalophilus levihalophilus]
MDTIEKIGNSVIQHGKYNDRVYLMKLDPSDIPSIMDKMDFLAEQKHYSKIFTKVPESFKKLFCKRGYICEASIPKYYDGIKDAVVMSKFLDPERSINRLNEMHKNVIETALSKEEISHSSLPSGYSIKKCTQEDIENMADVYQETFETYPFPIHDQDYLRKTMEENIIYFGVFKDGKIVALSSAEIDYEHSNVEMTDFATLSDFRGKGLSSQLLISMDKEMKILGIKTAYTIARASSDGMNIVFAKCGYDYCGRLINNTNISGDIESMNIWYRCL